MEAADDVLQPVRVTKDAARGRDWALVLESAGVPYRLDETEAGVAILVDGTALAAAQLALAAFDRETAERASADVPVPDRGPSAAGAVVALALSAFYAVTGPGGGSGARSWGAAGSALVDRLIGGGQWWRAVTALTLHSDLGHLAGNAVAALIFVTALGRWVGGPAALWLTIGAGAVGNVFAALWHGAGHNSLGASTATFGALGALGGLQLMRRRPAILRRRRGQAVVAALLGLFAMLGVGAHSDIAAHAFGLLAGAVLGAMAALLAGPAIRRPQRPLTSAALSLAALAAVIGCWALALAAPR